MSPASRMLSAISLGVLRRSAPSTSAIMRSRNDLPGSWVTRDHELVREQPGAAGHRRAVAAGLADDRRRLAGDGRLVDRADALDHLAVGGDHLARDHLDHVVALQLGRRHVLELAVQRLAVGDRGRAGGAQGVRLGLATALGDRLGEVCEQHRQPQPERRSCPRTRGRPCAAEQVDEEDPGRDDAADLDDEHHRVVRLQARVELGERVLDRRPDDVLGEHACRLLVPLLAVPIRSSARFSSSTFTPGSPNKPEPAAVGVLGDQVLDS